jgi:hypothetical protein
VTVKKRICAERKRLTIVVAPVRICADKRDTRLFVARHFLIVSAYEIDPAGNQRSVAARSGALLQ